MLLRAIAGFINTDKGYIKYNHKALHKDMDVLPDLGAVIEIFLLEYVFRI